MSSEHSKHLPLSPATLHILLALSSEDLHGYGIMLDVAKQSRGQYKIGPGTLYDNLKKLMHLGLIEESVMHDAETNSRRKYHLSEAGNSVLAAETERLAEVIQEARRRFRLTTSEQE